MTTPTPPAAMASDFQEFLHQQQQEQQQQQQQQQRHHPQEQGFGNGAKFHWPFDSQAGGYGGAQASLAAASMTGNPPQHVLPQQASSPQVTGGMEQGNSSVAERILPAPTQPYQQQQQQQLHRPASMSMISSSSNGGYHPPPILPRHDVAILPKPSAAVLMSRPSIKLEVGAPGVGGNGGTSTGNGLAMGMDTTTATATASTASSTSSSTHMTGAKRNVSATQSCASSTSGQGDGGMQEEDGGTEDRKKRLRNEREQRRAHLITDQIDSLKGVLENSNFPLRSTSKYDILAACDEYIQHLRQRKNCLDMELKLGSSNTTGSGGSNGAGGGGSNGPSSASVSSSSEDGESVQREVVLDFSEIFRSSHVPMAVVSIDGRILQCNDEFSRVTGYTNDKLAGVTLFSLASPECLEELFKSIARLLSTAALDEKNPAYFATAAARATPLSHPGYEHANILLSLVRDDERRARAFHCCIVPVQNGHQHQQHVEEEAADTAMS